MNRRLLLNLGLAIALVALVSVAVLRPGVEVPDDSITLAPLQRDAINVIRVQSGVGAPIQLEKSDGAWRVTVPLSARANSFWVNNLLDIIDLESRTRFPAQATQLQEYGLESPVAVARFDDVEVQFGAAHPIGTERYARVGDEIHVIADNHMRFLRGVVDDFIDTRFLDENASIESIELADFRVERHDGAWRRLPEQPALTSDALVDFIEQWRLVRALRVKPHAGAAAGETIRITLRPGDAPDAEPTTLTVGVLARTPELILLRPDEGLAYHLTAELGERLLHLRAE